MAAVKLLPTKAFNRTIAHLDGVIAAVAAEAAAGKARAESILAANGHGPAPHSHITVSHGSVDSFVNLVDPGGAAAAIEFGHTTKSGHAVQGVHAITGAF